MADLTTDTATTDTASTEQIPIFEYNDKTSFNDLPSSTLDEEWAKHSFLLSDDVLGDQWDIINRRYTTAMFKFTDTRLGGNIGINARPQFTRYSDIRVKGRLTGRRDVTLTGTSGNYGMGRYYSEALDDPAQRIYIQFGIPQFNSLTNFISRAFDYRQISIAKTGRAPSVFYDLARLAGTAAIVIAAPAISATIVAARFLSSFFIRPTSKFYTLKPTMFLYWQAVNTLVNTIAINRGIFPKIIGSENPDVLGNPFKLDPEYLTILSQMMPDTFRDHKFFDIFSMANRAQRINNKMIDADFDNLNNETPTDFTGYLRKELYGNGSHSTYLSNDKGEPTLADVFDRIFKFKKWFVDDTKADAETRIPMDPKLDEKGEQVKEPSFFKEYIEALDADFREGSDWAVFRVDHTGTVQESFGNSAIESDLSQKLNTTASQVREARFSFADGNVSNDAISQTVKAALGAAKDVVVGTLDGVLLGFGGLLAGLGGSGFIDIPKHWQSSTANLPKSTYTMDLISPYGNPYSQMFNIYIPLCMLLAGALPLSTGKSSYTSPFLCRIFDRGRSQIRLGMIESMSIERGITHQGFDLKGHALGLKVSFSVLDLSSIMHMPISTGDMSAVAAAQDKLAAKVGGAIGGTTGTIVEAGLGTSDMTLDEDNILADYLAVLAGQDMYTQMYTIPKAKLTIAKKLMQYNKLTSPAYLSALTHEEVTSGMMSYLTLGAFNAIEAATRGSSIITSDQLNQ
jgi:hypothetical protein